MLYTREMAKATNIALLLTMVMVMVMVMEMVMVMATRCADIRGCDFENKNTMKNPFPHVLDPELHYLRFQKPSQNVDDGMGHGDGDGDGNSAEADKTPELDSAQIEAWAQTIANHGLSFHTASV